MPALERAVARAANAAVAMLPWAGALARAGALAVLAAAACADGALFPAAAEEPPRAEQAVPPPPSRADTPSRPDAVLLNGALNVPGAPADSQTVPAKFSRRNDLIDKLPILAMRRFTDAERRTIVEHVRAENRPPANVDAELTQELSVSVPVYAFPPSLIERLPGLRDLKYVPTAHGVLLVYAPNMIVVGKIEG